MNTFNEAYLNTLNDQTPKKDRLEILIDAYKNKQNLSKEDIIELLHIAIIDEWLAEFNYFASYNLSKTSGKSDFDPEFEQHEEEERDHRKKITNRLRELGCKVPKNLIQDFFNINSVGLRWKQAMTNSSNDLLLDRYNEELNAIKFYGLIFSVLKRLPLEERDTTTEMLIKQIKADEETHAKDLKDLLVEHGILSSSLTEKGEEKEI